MLSKHQTDAQDEVEVFLLTLVIEKNVSKHILINTVLRSLNTRGNQNLPPGNWMDLSCVYLPSGCCHHNHYTTTLCYYRMIK